MATSSSFAPVGVLPPAQRIDRWVALRDMAAKLRDSVGQIDRTLRAFDRHDARTVTSVRTPQLDSRVLALRAGAATTLRSSAEIATATTSYTPYAPAWTGGSTASLAVSGTYTGTVDDTLTFTLTAPDGSGSANRELVVTDGSGAETGRFSLVDHGGAQQVTLANGLQVDLGDGALDEGDAFGINVSASVPSSLNPTKALGGTGVDRAGFDAGLAVTDGAFEVNGTSIDVHATDTLNDVLARINDAGLGLTAAYDAGTDRVAFTNDAVGAAGIALGNDTSGLLAALKLDGATATLGRGPDLTSRLSSVPALAGLTAGTIAVGDATVAVDPSADSLQDVLARITADAAAKTTAAWDAGSGTVQLRARDQTSSIVLGADQTGLIAALSLHGGVTESSVVYGPLRASAYDEIGSTLSTVQQRIAELRSGSSSAAAKIAISRHQEVLGSLRARDRTVLDALGALTDATAVDDAARTRRMVALRSSNDGFAAVLRGSVSSHDDGYLDRMRDVLARAATDLEVEASLLG